MTQKYEKDIMLRKLDTKIKTLESNPNLTQEEVDSAVRLYKNIINLGRYSSEDVQELEDRLRAFAPDLSSSLDEVVNDNELQKLNEISPKSYKMKKVKIKSAIAGGAIAIILASVGGCSLRNNKQEEQPVVVEKQVEEVKPQVIEPKELDETKEVEKVLAENLSFDPNDNTEIVNRMADFIADALTKGIPVKDVMTEEELKTAEENEESLVTIKQLMDFYIVMNIEDIDPEDYARLKYNTKTAETITDNYMYCARLFMTDALTANEETKIDYSEIIADKDSSEIVQKFVDYLAKYNSATDKKTVASSISEYIVSNYINRDANLYSMSANELTYRMMFVADMISNNSIIPKDVNIILNEDGKISCDIQKEDGVKNKTEKAEEFTSIYNTVDEKLEISREFASQELSSISDEEKKTGSELEKEIKEQVLIKNVSYKLNPKFTMAEGSKNISAKKTTNNNNNNANNSYKTFTDKSTGKQVNVSNEELAKYGAKNQAEYEAAKKKEFEDKAKKDPGHNNQDNDGNVVTTGDEVDTEQYNAGYAAGYADGNYYDGSYRQSNPNSTNKSYVAGYNAGFREGRAVIEEFLKSLQPPESSFEPVDGTTPTPQPTPPVESPITEEPYLPDPSVPENPEPDPTPDPSIPEDPGTWEEFEPVEENVTVETPTETIEETSYTSSINSLKSLREELLNMSNVYTEEVSKMK